MNVNFLVMNLSCISFSPGSAIHLFHSEFSECFLFSNRLWEDAWLLGDVTGSLRKPGACQT